MIRVHKKRIRGMWSYVPPARAACGLMIGYDVSYRMAWAWKKVTCMSCLKRQGNAG